MIFKLNNPENFDLKVMNHIFDLKIFWNQLSKIVRNILITK